MRGIRGVRRGMRCVVCVLALAVLALCPAGRVHSAAGAAQEDIQIELLFDYDSTVKVGRSLSVRAAVFSPAKDVEGTVLLKTSRYRQEGVYYSTSTSILGFSFEGQESGRDYDNYVIEKPLSMKAGETAQVRFDLPYTSPAPYIQILVKDAEGNTLAHRDIELSLRERTGELSVGLLSDQAEELSYLDEAHLEGYSHVTTNAVALSEDSLSPTVYGLDMLDLIVVQDFDVDKLAGEQMEALRAWVRKGGIVVFGKDTEEEEPAQNRNAGEEEEKAQSQDSQGQMISEDAGISQHMGGSAYEKRLYGDGTVLFAPYSFSGLAAGSEQETAEELFTAAFTTEFLQEVDSGGDYFRYEKYWDLVSRLDSIDSSNIPNPAVYGGVLLLYALLAGPVVYIVLKRLGRRKYLWGCVGVLSVLFCGILFVMGSRTRFNAPFFHYVRVLNQEEGYEDEEVQFKVQSPSNNAYSVYLNNDYTIMPVVEAGDYYGDYEYPADFSKESTKLIYRETEKEIRMEKNRAFTEKYFTAEKTRKLDGEWGLSGSIAYYDGQLSGTLRNDTGYDLEDGMLFFQNHLVYVGSMAAGEEKDVADCEQYAYAPGYSYMLLRECLGREEDYASEITPDFLEKAWKEAILSGELMNGYDSEEEGCVFAGFVEADAPAFTEDSAYQLYGMTMLRTHVNLQFTGEEDGEVWVYDPFVTGTAQVESGDYSSYDNTYYSGEVTVTYSLPKGLDEVALMFDNEQYYDSEYYTPYSGTVELLNVNTGRYEALGNYEGNVGGGAQTGVRGEWIAWGMLRSYVSADGTISVRYKREGASSDKNEMLPVLRAKGRAAYAEN